MKTMASYSSATTREPHVNRKSRTNTIVDALKQRAQAVLNDKSIDRQSRAIIRQALETNDPWLARLVRQADAVEDIVQPIETESPDGTNGDGSNKEKVEALAEMICNGSEEASAALFVLMGALQNSTEPKALAHVVKHFAFTRCGELNVYGMIESQMVVLERELFA